MGISHRNDDRDLAVVVVSIYSLPDKVFGLRYRSPPFDDVRFVRITQGVSSSLAKKRYLKAYIKNDREGLSMMVGNAHPTRLNERQQQKPGISATPPGLVYMNLIVSTLLL